MAFPPSIRRKSRPPLCIMVVEDDAVLGLALEDVLTADNFAEVTICSTASTALSNLRSHTYDAVVLDVHLADRDEGWEIAELIDALGKNETRIIFQTGSPDDIPPHVRELGPVLVKPYDPQDLLSALRQVPRPKLLTRFRKR